MRSPKTSSREASWTGARGAKKQREPLCIAISSRARDRLIEAGQNDSRNRFPPHLARRGTTGPSRGECWLRCVSDSERIA
jgi:hypothetical protein